MNQCVSVIIPCWNEEGSIGRALRAVLEQTDYSSGMEVIIVLNGCTDRTRSICERYLPDFQLRGIDTKILETEIASKSTALNIGDASATGGIRVYMDADVIPEPGLIAQLQRALSVEAARYATGTLVPASNNWMVRAYGKAWSMSPPIAGEVNGIGLYAVNAAGRRRWSCFPAIHSDDAFVRLQFERDERVRVPARYIWPLPSSWLRLVRVRLRWTEGNFEVKRRYPELVRSRWRRWDRRYAVYLLRSMRMPLCLAVFAGIYVLCRLIARRNVDTRHEQWYRAQ